VVKVKCKNISKKIELLNQLVIITMKVIKDNNGIHMTERVELEEEKLIPLSKDMEEATGVKKLLMI